MSRAGRINATTPDHTLANTSDATGKTRGDPLMDIEREREIIRRNELAWSKTWTIDVEKIRFMFASTYTSHN